MLQRRRMSSGGLPTVPGAPGAHGAAAVRALRGEEVLAWSSGHERRDDAGGDIGGRKRLLRRGPTPGAPALLVASQSRRGGALRVHLLAEVGLSARSWPLADLRLVDGLGIPVRVATDFALTFAGAPRPLLWRCDSPERRAQFLWTLLQVCASKLPGRAPPSQRLSLLELQTFAKEVAASAKRPSSQEAAGLPLPAKRLSDINENGSLPERKDATRRVTRTTSEPQAGALHRLVERAEGINLPRRSVDGPLGVRPRVSVERDMTVFEHAFALAARRIGARPPQFKRSRPQTPVKNADGRESSSTGGGYDNPVSPQLQSPKGGALSRGPSASSLRNAIEVHEGASATALLVARCKAQEERRLFRLESDEAEDLDYVLQLFHEADPRHKLCDLEGWALEQMHEIEAANMAETAGIELNAQSSVVAAYRKALVDTVNEAEPWLKPTEARLAPYASLIEDIRSRADMLDRHRANAVQLYDRLHDLLENSLWSSSEEEKIVSLVEQIEKSPGVLSSDDAFLFGTVVPAVNDLARKLNYSPDCTLMEDISGFADTRLEMKLRGGELTSYLVPCFKERAVQLRDGCAAPYMACSSSFSFSLLSTASASPSRAKASEQRGVQERTTIYAEGVKSLSTLDCCAGRRLLDEYRSIAQIWTETSLLKMKDETRDEIHEASVARPRAAAEVLTQIAETLAVLLVQEATAVYQLFGASSTELEATYPNIMTDILQKQFESSHSAVEELMSEFGDSIAPKLLGSIIFGSFSDFFTNGDAKQIHLLMQNAIRNASVESDDDEHEEMEVEKEAPGDDADGARSCQSPEVSRVTVSPTSSDQIEYSGSQRDTGKERATFVTPKKQTEETFPCMPGLRRSDDDTQREGMHATMRAVAHFVSSEFKRYAAACTKRLQAHEDTLLLCAKTKRGVVEEVEFFGAVRDIVDAVCSMRMCYQDLTELRRDAIDAGDLTGSVHALLDGALARFDCAPCERLVMGAIQHAEASASGTRSLYSTDNVQLQAYAYISKRLLRPASPLSTPPALAPVVSSCRAASQKRIQVVKRMLEQRVLDSHFEALKVFMEAPLPFDPRKISSAIKVLDPKLIAKEVCSVMEQAVAATKGAVQVDPLLQVAADVTHAYISDVAKPLHRSDELLKERDSLKRLKFALSTLLLATS